MSKLLTCPGPPEHQFSNPNEGKRGRPPKYCDEHKPVKPESNSKRVTDVTGVTPSESSNPFIKKALANPADNPFMKKAQVAVEEPEKPRRRRKVKEESAKPQERLEDIEQEYLGIDDQIARAKREYEEAFAKATSLATDDDIDWYDVKNEFEHAWARCDSKMNALISILARKRKLEQQIEILTDPNYEKLEDRANKVTPIQNGTDPDVEEDDVTDQFAAIMAEFDGE